MPLFPSASTKYFFALHRLILLTILCSLSSFIFAQQQAYNGPHTIPGIIEAENFDLGGEGVAYHDNEPGQLTTVSNYRTATDPDVEVEFKPQNSNEHIVGWTSNGEWYEYTFNVEETDDYVVLINATGRNVNSQGFKLFIDDEAVSEEVAISPETDWFTDWDEYGVEVNLSAGEHVLKVEIFSNNQYAINLDYIKILPASVVGGTPLDVTNLIQNNAVLQRNEEVTIWGKGNPGFNITVDPEWGDAITTTVGTDEKWSVKIPTIEAGGPYNLSIDDGFNSFSYSGIQLGEVWICAGQSNMAMPLAGWGAGGMVVNAAEEIANANYPEMRFFGIPRVASFEPESDVEGFWRICTPNQAQNLSATAYFFAREIHLELGVPVGVIVLSRGNSGAEAWASAESLSSIEGYENVIQDLADSQNGNGPYSIDHLWDDSQLFDTPGTLFNGIISPILPYTVKGVNWYQGESNTGTAFRYRSVFTSLINSWRAEKNSPELPFHYVQISPYNYNVNSAVLREAQFFTQSIPFARMAVTLDAGEQYQIHPGNKQAVGKRLGLWALSEQYEQNIIPSGPIYNGSEFGNGKGILKFDYIGSGLQLIAGPNNFEIAGRDGIFYEADAIINGDEIEVSSTSVAEPIQARYAWENWVEPTLYNLENLPSSSFTTYNAYVFSTDYQVDQNMVLITVPGTAMSLTVQDFISNLTTVSGATMKVINQNDEEQTSGFMSDNFRVLATMDNGQDTRVYEVALDNLIATNDLDLEHIEIYPNPFSDTLNLKNLRAKSLVRIVSVSGKVMLSKVADTDELKIDLNDFPQGTYLLVLNENEVYKLIKK